MHTDAGKKVKGTVTGITGFGAFVRLEDGRTGLIHISQVSDAYVTDVHDFLTVGQEVEPTVLSVDEKGRLAFTLKSAPRKAPPTDPAQPAVFTSAPSPVGFEDMLSRYKSASEDKMNDLRKVQGGKFPHKRKIR